jgi:ATP-dependent protease HslVU (ClpYQ) ATPase subunit
MNDPARYDRKFNYLIEAMMESILKSSKHVDAEELSNNKTYIMEKLRDIVGNVSLSIFFKWCKIRTCGNCTYYVN